jgi:hypothetical protein
MRSNTTGVTYMINKMVFAAVLLGLSACSSLEKMVQYEDQTTREKIQEIKDPLGTSNNKSIAIGAPLNTLSIENKAGKITINGKTYINDQASIEKISHNSDSGQITYISSRAKNGKKITELFIDTPFSNKKPLLIGAIDTFDGEYTFTNTKGIQRNAIRFTLLSQGVLLEHEGGFFSYLNATGFSSLHEIPKNFSFSPIQANDISKAGFIALIRDFGPIKIGFLEVKNIREYELIFIDINDGTIRSSEKIRLDVETQDQFNLSIKQRLAIHMSNKGLVVINISSDYKNLMARNLHKGTKKSLSFRDSGIAHFWSGIDRQGKIWIEYTYGASEKRTLQDVAQALDL